MCASAASGSLETRLLATAWSLPCPESSRHSGCFSCSTQSQGAYQQFTGIHQTMSPAPVLTTRRPVGLSVICENERERAFPSQFLAVPLFSRFSTYATVCHICFFMALRTLFSAPDPTRAFYTEMVQYLPVFSPLAGHCFSVMVTRRKDSLGQCKQRPTLLFRTASPTFHQ